MNVIFFNLNSKMIVQCLLDNSSLSDGHLVLIPDLQMYMSFNVPELP